MLGISHFSSLSKTCYSFHIVRSTKNTVKSIIRKFVKSTLRWFPLTCTDKFPHFSFFNIWYKFKFVFYKLAFFFTYVTLIGDTKVPTITSISNMFSITTLFSTLTIDKEFDLSHPVHFMIAMTCARCRNFSSSRPVCSPSSFVVRRDESRGSWADSSRFVASTRTLDRKFLGDNLQELAAESVIERRRRDEKHFSKIMLHRDSNS